MAMRQPYEDSLAAREIVPELQQVNAKLDEGFAGVNTELHAGFTTLAGLLREMRDEAREQHKELLASLANKL